MVSKIKQLWSGQQGLQSAAALLMVMVFFSNILGFFRDALLANVMPFASLDIYYAAFRIPDLLFNLLILGAISSAFIPVFTDVKTKHGDEAGWDLTSNLINTALIVLVVFGILLWVFMPNIMPLFVPGFDQARINLAVPLARVLLISPLFFALSYIISGLLNVYKRFFSYALAPLVYNVAIIIGAILSRHYGIYAVAWSVVAGALLHLLVQLPSLKSIKYTYKPILNWRDEALGRITRLMIPRSLSLGINQFVLVAFTRLGSLMPIGAISIYNLTNNFQTMPTAVFASSISTAVFPLLGLAKSENNDKNFGLLITDSIRGMLFFMIPSTFLMWVLRAHMIRLYLALNGRSWTDTIRAINTFEWLLVALAFQGFSMVIIRAYYARHDTKTPLLISVLSGLTAIITAVVLTKYWPDVPTLALSLAASAILEAIVFWVVFNVKWPGLLATKPIIKTTVGTLILAGISALLTKGALWIISDGFSVSQLQTTGLGTEHVVYLLVALLGAGSVGVLSYLGLAYFFKRDELNWLIPKRAAAGVILPDTEDLAQPQGLAN